ncbi:hypothetical protein B0H14DRAFT_61829 [Mycena olivaceomarginata]|nr:hypothetical protein B0H14DRAFT_61829 [Mycena olivaceomarginata]
MGASSSARWTTSTRLHSMSHARSGLLCLARFLNTESFPRTTCARSSAAMPVYERSSAAIWGRSASKSSGAVGVLRRRPSVGCWGASGAESSAHPLSRQWSGLGLCRVSIHRGSGSLGGVDDSACSLTRSRIRNHCKITDPSSSFRTSTTIGVLARRSGLAQTKI